MRHSFYSIDEFIYIFFYKSAYLIDIYKSFPVFYFILLVTSYCYGMLSYKTSHATANIFWFTVLHIWVLIIPYPEFSALVAANT
jgi:hypothetical protein